MKIASDCSSLQKNKVKPLLQACITIEGVIFMQLNWSDFKHLLIRHKFLIGLAAIIFVGVLLFLVLGEDDSASQNKDNHLLRRSQPDEHAMVQAKKEDSVKQSAGLKTSQNTEDIYVDVKGAVERPDIYHMKPNDRVKQLLEKAHVTKDADLSTINLSERLVDQKLIIIPRKGENTPAPSITEKSTESGKQVGSSSSKKSGDTVNINTASESDLQKVPGIGPSKAKSIIEYRDSIGRFDSIDKIKEVSGIGEKTFEKLASYLTV